MKRYLSRLPKLNRMRHQSMLHCVVEVASTLPHDCTLHRAPLQPPTYKHTNQLSATSTIERRSGGWCQYRPLAEFILQHCGQLLTFNPVSPLTTGPPPNPYILPVLRTTAVSNFSPTLTCPGSVRVRTGDHKPTDPPIP